LSQIAVNITDMDISGKTAIITGATGNLAEAVVLTLAKAGANCICLYNKNSAQAEKLRKDLKKLKPKSLFIQTDLTNEKAIEKTFAEIERFAVPQILINAAAIFDKKPIAELSFDYIRRTLDVNFTAPMLITKSFVSLVRKKVKSKTKPLAKIINLTDIVAESPPAGFSIYSASKAALICATKSLAKELAPDFTVNAVSPGVINFQKGTSAKLRKIILSHIPAARQGRPAEVASAVKFLIENDYITGQVINIDGGRTV
jgi:NAD(P)-dependent dehydrogenase (short-subunit alcohol dehydrogenase family)